MSQPNAVPLTLIHFRSFLPYEGEVENEHWTAQEVEEIHAAVQANSSDGEKLYVESILYSKRWEIPDMVKGKRPEMVHISGDTLSIDEVNDADLPYEQQLLKKGATTLKEQSLPDRGMALPESEEGHVIVFPKELREGVSMEGGKLRLLVLNFSESVIYADELKEACESLIVLNSKLDSQDAQQAAVSFSQRFYFYLLRFEFDIEEAFKSTLKDLDGMGLRDLVNYQLSQGKPILKKSEPLSKEQVSFDEPIPAEEQMIEEEIFPTEEAAEEEQVAENEAKEKAPQESIPAEDDPFVNTRLHADHWAEEDLLGYERYAHNIEQIIKRKRAKPPLTIGIIAPWGQGKTTLMRYVERRFEGATSNPKNHKKGKLNTQATKDTIESWSKENTYQKDSFPRYPCVWFNPWQYQSSEQIWAGMAHAIIHQLVEKLSPIKQEEFWFKLQTRRIDKQAIRRDAIRDAITQTIPAMLIFVVTAILLPLLLPKNGWPLFLSFGVPISAILAAAKNGLDSYAKSFRDRYNKYLQSPDYEKKLGYFHDVNEDLERVFDLLVEEDTPALIFIDDLDRCSPKKVVEVIEAINLMMNASFRKKCYFILGMDAEMVAASIDVAYSNMKGSIPGKVNKFGSVGWYFLDKFIQLPFLIPTLSDDRKLNLVSHLFEEELKEEKDIPSRQNDSEEKPPVKEEVITKKRVEDLQVKARTLVINPQPRSLNPEARTPLVKINSQVERKVFEESFLDLGFEQLEKENELQKRVGRFAQYLDPSPRSIKRFANLLRFHAALQKLREVTNNYLDIEGDTESYEEFADMDTLAFWLILTLRWPLLVRWLQWESEDKLDTDLTTDENLLFASNQTHEKARMLDKLIRESMDRAKKIGNNEAGFEKLYGEWLELHKANTHLTWLKDKELLKLFFDLYSEEKRMERAFLCAVW